MWTVGRLHQIFMLHHEQVRISNHLTILWSHLMSCRLRGTAPPWRRCSSRKTLIQTSSTCSTSSLPSECEDSLSLFFDICHIQLCLTSMHHCHYILYLSGESLTVRHLGDTNTILFLLLHNYGNRMRANYEQLQYLWTFLHKDILYTQKIVHFECTVVSV